MNRKGWITAIALAAIAAHAAAEDAGAVLEAVAKHLPPGVEPSTVYQGIVLDSAQGDAIRIAAFDRLAKEAATRDGGGKEFIELCCKVLEGGSSPKLDKPVICALAGRILRTSHCPLKAQTAVLHATRQATERRKVAIRSALAWSESYESTVDVSREALARTASDAERPFDIGLLPTSLPSNSLGVVSSTAVAVSPACAPLTTVRRVKAVRLPEVKQSADAVPLPKASPFPGSGSRYCEQFPTTDRLASSPERCPAAAGSARPAELSAPAVGTWAIPGDVPDEWRTAASKRARGVQEALAPEPRGSFLPAPGASKAQTQLCIAGFSDTEMATTPSVTVRAPEGLLSGLSCPAARDAIEGLPLPEAAQLPTLRSDVGAFDGSPSPPPANSPARAARATVSVPSAEVPEQEDLTAWCRALGEQNEAVMGELPPRSMDLPEFDTLPELPTAVEALSSGAVSLEALPVGPRHQITTATPVSLTAAPSPREWQDALLARSPSLGTPTAREWQDSILGGSPPIALQPVPFNADDHWLGTYLPAIGGITQGVLDATDPPASVQFARPTELPPASRILDCPLPAIPEGWAVATQRQSLGVNQGLPMPSVSREWAVAVQEQSLETTRAVPHKATAAIVAPESLRESITPGRDSGPTPIAVSSAEMPDLQWPVFHRDLERVGGLSVSLLGGSPDPPGALIGQELTPLAARESQADRLSETLKLVAIPPLLEPIKKRLSVEQFAEIDLMLSRGQTEPALALFARIVKADPESDSAKAATKKAFDVLSGIAKGRDLEAKFEGWLGNLGNAIDAEHREYLLADALYRSGSFSRGVERARAFLKEHPESKRAPNARMLIALCCARQEKREEAIKELKQLLSAFPQSELAPRAQFLIGWLYMFSGQEKEAIAAYRSVKESYAESEYAKKAKDYLVQLGAEEPEPAGAVLPEKVPSYTCRRATSAIAIDGTPREAAWESAERINDLSHVSGASKDENVVLKTEARLLWDAKYLYVAFIFVESEISAKLSKRDAELWQEDCTGIFLSTGQTLGATSKSGVYYKIQVNPLNTVHDAKIVHWSEKVTDDELKAAPLWNCSDLRTAVRAIEPKQQQKKVQIWLVEMAIPFVNLGAVPSVGDTWKMNVCRIDKARPIPRTLSWAPVERWFHEPARFGNLKFVR